MSFIEKVIALFVPPRLSVDEEIAKMQKDYPASQSFATTLTQTPRLLTTAEMLKHYGNPGDPDNHVVITSPFYFKIAWDLSQKTNRISVHKKVAPRLLLVLQDLLLHYGADGLDKLGINLFGGLGNFRPQRGLEKKYAAAIKAKNYALAYTYLSRHSWWTAIDLDPARNTLKETSRTARFARAEYAPMIKILNNHGFVSYGVIRNNDWMHFEIGIIL